MKPRLSILIPTYRRPENLERALSSILLNLDEDFRNELEIIVREDSSGDAYGSRYQRVEAKFAHFGQFNFNQANLGMASNLRTLVDDANGKFILILTDDDQIAEGGLRALLKVLDNAERHQVGTVLLPRHSYLEDGKKITVSSRTTGLGLVGKGPTSALRLCSRGFILTGMVFENRLIKNFDWDRFGENAYFPIALQYHALRQAGGLRSHVQVVRHTVYNETHWHRWGSNHWSQRERLARDSLEIFDDLTSETLEDLQFGFGAPYVMFLRWFNSVRIVSARALDPHAESLHAAYAQWRQIRLRGTLRSKPVFFVVTKGAVAIASVVRGSRGFRDRLTGLAGRRNQGKQKLLG